MAAGNRMQRLNLKHAFTAELLIFGIILAGAAYCRFWAAPHSAGPDVVQYWAFARQFQESGLDFYRFAEATGDLYPFPGWNFVYPPVWLLILRFALFATPTSYASLLIVTTDWRIAEKLPIILADLVIGILIYRFVSGSSLKKLLLAGAWLLSPAVWYQSAVFGQFDAVASAFLLGAILLLERGKDRAAFILAGLAVMTKQHTLIPVTLMLAAWFPMVPRRRFFRGCAIMAGVGLVLSFPFLVTGNFVEYTGTILFGAHGPGYQEPLSYTFNGLSALLTHLHNIFGWSLHACFNYFIPVLVVSLAGCGWLVYRLRLSPARAALIGFLLFLLFFYRINYQYLVVFIALALYIAGTTTYRGERLYLVFIALVPSVWLWIFDISFWFQQYLPVNASAIAVLDRLVLTRTGTPDLWFVILAGVLWTGFITYIGLACCRWRKTALLIAPALLKKQAND